MTSLPTDGFEGVDYSFLDDTGVPQEFKDKFETLRAEMDALLAIQKQQVSQTQNDIAVLMSWATVANNALNVVKSLIPLIPVGQIAGGNSVTEEDKQCWLSKLGDLDGLLSMLRGF